MTPPVDEEQEIKEARILEEEARKALENDGCPPCYQLTPPEQEPIVLYWRSFPGAAGLELCCQWNNWQQFRTFQSQIRRQKGKFNIYKGKAKERLLQYNIVKRIPLRRDLKRQCQLGTWLEFQNYTLIQQEYLDDRQNRLETALQASSTKNATAAREALNAAQARADDHGILVSWVETKRLDLMKQKEPHGTSKSRASPSRARRPQAPRIASSSEKLVTTKRGRISRPPSRYIP